MSNTLTGLIPTLYKALDVVSRELVGLIPSVSRDSNLERAAKGQAVRSPVVPAATSYDITPGTTAPDTGDQTITYKTISIDNSKYAPVRWEGEEELSVGDQLDPIVEKQFAQAMRSLVNKVEVDLGELFVSASRAYGTAGTPPFSSSLSDAANVLKILKDNGAPQSDLRLVLGTSAGVNLRSLTQLTNVNQAGSDDPLRRGVLLPAFGMDIRESAGIQTKSKGTTTNVTVTGSNAIGTTTVGVTTASGGAVTLAAGDYISIAGDSEKYIVTTSVSIGASTTGNIVIAAPGLRSSTSGTEAVSTAAADFEAGMAFHESAIHLVTRAPAMPRDGDASTDVVEIMDPVSRLGFQIAAYKEYRRVKYEVGLAWGCACIKPEHLALLIG
jgi:hypothetical protein